MWSWLVIAVIAFVVLVADRGMYSGTNMCHVLDAFNLDIKPKIYTKGEIRELKASVSAILICRCKKLWGRYGFDARRYWAGMRFWKN